MQISAAVGIEHIEHAGKGFALHDSHAVIAVTRKLALNEQTIYRVHELLALPVDAHCARSFVIAEHGRPRHAEFIHKLHEFLKHRAVIVELAVNEVARQYNEVGFYFIYSFRYIIITMLVYILFGIEFHLARAKPFRPVLRGVYYLRIGKLQYDGLFARGNSDDEIYERVRTFFATRTDSVFHIVSQSLYFLLFGIFATLIRAISVSRVPRLIAGRLFCGNFLKFVTFRFYNFRGSVSAAVRALLVRVPTVFRTGSGFGCNLNDFVFERGVGFMLRLIIATFARAIFIGVVSFFTAGSGFCLDTPNIVPQSLYRVFRRISAALVRAMNVCVPAVLRTGDRFCGYFDQIMLRFRFSAASAE